MTDIFQGDPKLFIDEDGAYLKWTGGQCVMDKGIENLAYISLLTAPDWWGNDLFSNPDNQIGSDFEELSKGSITLQTLIDIEQSAERALQNPAFGEPVATASNPRAQGVELTIEIAPPASAATEINLIKNFQNWVNQASDPAYVKE